ncbi:MAG: hypothetical protein MUC68_09860 [Burkholderiaceae bacterium]|nr:hypothetical protein [Burkholderiaceae bacterium]
MQVAADRRKADTRIQRIRRRVAGIGEEKHAPRALVDESSRQRGHHRATDAFAAPVRWCVDRADARARRCNQRAANDTGRLAAGVDPEELRAESQ